MGAIGQTGALDRKLDVDKWHVANFLPLPLMDDPTWLKIKEAIGPEKLIGMPLKVVQELATKVLTTWALKKLGL